MSRVLRLAPIIVLVVFAMGTFAAPILAAQAYTVTVQTSSPTYSGATPILITGTVSPAPGPGTAVVITIKNPAGSAADLLFANVDGATGNFNSTSVPGGSAAWTTGTYTVNATWGGPGGNAFGTTTFAYTAA
ncbi:MAG TPA: hypothetical protein VGS04_07850, partial [Nitrososphaerales archaeon]|nr:hypothetical protein [Nitrososphaerales archaeon]